MNAFRFIRKIKKVNFINVKQYLERNDWTLIYFNTPFGDDIVDKLKLNDMVNRSDGFVFSANSIKYVFINKNLCEYDRLLVLLHETAHIVLNHDLSNTTKLDEAEAWAFVHDVMNYRSAVLKRVLVIFIICTIAVLCCSIFWTIHVTDAALNAIKTTSEIADVQNEEVYITPSGTKYHRKECIFVRDNDECIAVKKKEASRKYYPCEYCNP